MATKRNAALGRRGNQQAAELKAALTPDVPLFPYAEGLTEEEKPIWLDMVNSQPVDFFTRGDVPLLKMYCRAYADVERLTNDIREEGEVITNANDNLVMNPKVTARNYAEARLMSLSTKLRMQPQSRTTIRGQEAKAGRKAAARNVAKAIEDDDLLAGGLDTPGMMQ